MKRTFLTAGVGKRVPSVSAVGGAGRVRSKTRWRTGRVEALEICCVLLAVVALPVAFDATTGCSFAPGIAPVYPNSYVCSCDCEPGERHRDLRVSFVEDDAEQQLPSQNNNILLNSPDLDFLNGRFVGLRFRDVGIPPGAGILHARVQFTVAPGSATGLLTVQIAGEAADNAPPFSTTPGSLGALPVTANSVQWNPPDWTVVGNAGADQLTPDFAGVLQEIVNRGGWAEGNALVLLFKGTAGTGLRKAYSLDGGGLNQAAVLSVDYTEPLSNVEVLQHLPVCVPPAFNQNIDVNNTAPTDADLMADCSGRVQTTVGGLAKSCNYPSLCTCSFIAGSQAWKSSCDADTGSGPGVCTAVPLAPDCSNFNPPAGIVTATNANGDQPVCAANSPLSAELFGRNTSCEVSGTAHIKVGDDSKESDATGLVEFVGDQCPGSDCALVGMKYRLNIDPVTFGNFFDSETFSDLGGLGENGSGTPATPSGTGGWTFGQNALAASAQGRRGGGGLKGLASTNGDPVAVNVGFGQSTPVCSVKGTLAGSVDPEAKRCKVGSEYTDFCKEDSDCPPDDACAPDGVCPCVPWGSQDMNLSLDVAGNVVNQPPTADAGPDQSVECTTAAVTDVVLDARGSSDPDANIKLYSWLRGNRTGKEVAFDEVSTIEQSLGSQTYVLRVIDALGQTDEDTTEVAVVDTTPPVVTCSVITPLLNQTNHDLVDVGLRASAVDQCEGVLPVGVKVFSDEDDEENTGDGRFSPDARDIAVGSLRLRAERKGSGDGRVYLIIPEATDSSDNRGFSCCTVTVPLSRSTAAQMSAQGQAAAARAFCRAHYGVPPAGYFVIGDGPVIGPKQ